MKINLSYPATGCQKLIEIADELKVRPFYEKRMGQEVEADTLGDEFKGYVLRITGGNDKLLLVLGEHVLPAHPQHIVHRVPKFTESIEFRVVKLDWRRSYARIWTALFALDHIFGSLGEVGEACVAKLPVACSIEVNYLRVFDRREEVGPRQAEGGKVKRKADVVFHAKRAARVFQSVVDVLPWSYTFAVECNLK